MIAAAAAAMIGGAEATVTNVYDFVANLQTTTGAKAGATPDTWDVERSIDFGADSDSARFAAFWYDANGLFSDWRGRSYRTKDGATYKWTNTGATRFPHLVWTTHWVDGVEEVPALEINQYNDDGELEALNNNELTLLQNLHAQYPYTSADTMCCTVYWVEKTPGDAAACYRVAGADWIEKELFLEDNCCEPTTGRGYFFDKDGNEIIRWQFLNRFGDRNKDWAKQLEIFASVTGPADPKDPAQAPGLVTGNHSRFLGMIAGQGWWEEISGKRVPMSLDGSIVGYGDSLCLACCKSAAYSNAFDCLDADAFSANELSTAMYGTFYLSYKYSK